MDTQWLKRELKFRAWLVDEERMDDKAHMRAYFGPRCEVPNENEILMQFTGLKDKNGVEIYEGDIIKNENSENAGDDTYTWISQVMWLMDEARWGGADGERVKVIGNVFENPELLTK